MQNEYLQAVIWISSENKKFQVSHSDFNLIREAFSPEISVSIIPIPVDERYRGHGAFETASVSIFIYATLAFLVAKIFESILKEAGGDIYRAIKAKMKANSRSEQENADIVDLLAHIAARNDARSYRLHQDFQVGCTLNDQNVVIHLFIASPSDREYMDIKRKCTDGLVRISEQNVSDKERETMREELFRRHTDELVPMFRKLVRDEFLSLRADWDKVLEDIDRFKVGSEPFGWSDNNFHEIRRLQLGNETRWTISARRPTGGHQLW